jgi:hypothetical protein
MKIKDLKIQFNLKNTGDKVNKHLPTKLQQRDLTPFTVKPKKVEGGYDLKELLTSIFDSEAKELKIDPVDYEYCHINKIYKPDHPALETHYFIFDAGSGAMRMAANLMKEEIKKHNIDLGKLFEKISFEFKPVLFEVKDVHVPGYGHFHSFLNRLNQRLREYNLLVVYVRQYDEDITSGEYFNDHLSTIFGVHLPCLGKVAEEHTDAFPVKEIKERKLHTIEVKGGMLFCSPIDSTSWSVDDLNYANDPKERKDMSDWEIPYRNRMGTLHYLNGATPNYFREKILDGFGEIMSYRRGLKQK